MFNKKELSQMSTLIRDASANRVAMFSDVNSAKHADDAIRKFHEEILGGELNWQSWRFHKNEIFTVWENVLKPELPEAWKTSPFYKRVCEVKNGLLGDKNSFAVRDKSYLAAAKFSGGTWDVEYQKIGRAKNIAIETEWSFVGCYEELDRFLKGYTTIVEMLNEVREGFAIDMDNRIATVFNGMGAFLPSKFVEQGTYDKDTLVDLIRRVRTANRKNVIVAGSQRAIVIPDSFVPFTYDFAGTDDTLYVLPDEQIIKIFYEGDLRAKEAHEQDEHDQTIRIQFQHNVGVEVVTSDLFAKYTIA